MTAHLRSLRAFVSGASLAIVTLSATVCHGIGPGRDESDAGREQTQRGLAAFDRGDFGQAIVDWEKAVKFYRAHHDNAREIDAQIRLATAYENVGQFSNAIGLLHDAVNLAVADKDRRRIILAKSDLGEAYSFTRHSDLADADLHEALSLALADQDLKAAAAIYNSLGNLYAAQDRSGDALEAYLAAASSARQMRDELMAAKALGNAAFISAQGTGTGDAGSMNDAAMNEVRQTPDSHDKAFTMIVCARTYQQLWRGRAASRDALYASATNAYLTAVDVAQNIHDDRAAGYALAGLGGLYEQDGRYADGLELTRRAVFLAQKMQSPDTLYQWEWQTGRLLRALGRTDEAIAAYRRAIQSLQPIRNDLYLAYANRPGPSLSRAAIGQIYYELADALLRQADTLTNPDQVQTNLVAVRGVVEQLKTAELQDYFQCECDSLTRKTPLERVSSNATVIYLIPLRDRTEVLAGFSSGIERFKAPVGSDELTEEVQRFRKNLEKRTTYEYLEQARHLYDWLIRPLRDDLDRHGIQTLVFVPDGTLQTVPLGALQDGERFLIQDFSVAVTPGLSLTAPEESGQRNRGRVLVAGLSQAVQGFPPLDYIPAELQNLHALYPGEELFNTKFLNATLEKNFAEEQYSIVHIASHGQFEHDCYKTFILTYDDKLTMDDLEHLISPSQFRRQPVELLTLSACQTAAGDDRAALGLAGVAVKAGARSALATLWFVNDQASASLMSEFYSQMARDHTVSKARALQLAQQKLLADRRYHHPCYWAPYLLIGNWL
ncbi:MAG TPA: CHAT domain-containing protein [Verrucomicrobiae bacterium]|nr:CHAT domain-containing protein [Verrucomicrobiae bacterium]